MKKYRLYWLDNSIEDIFGDDIADALRRANIGAGTLRGLDYHLEIKEDNGPETVKGKTN
jgi:hypothetical protein